MHDFFNESILQITEDAFLLTGFALPEIAMIWQDIQTVISQAPLSSMQTQGGLYMSVQTTSCGELGWVSDRKGYRYSPINPLTRQKWPIMPESLRQLAQSAGSKAGFADFQPDSCLINQYNIGAKMGLHQDKDERDFSQPIVSVSLGLPATFQFGGAKRSDKTAKVQVHHGDVVVWGGISRLYFHGVSPIKPGNHTLLGMRRINLTFRKAG